MKRSVQGLKKKCAFDCIYCFTHEDYETKGQSKLNKEELQNVELIQPFCDYDVFACENNDWEREISEYSQYGKIISYATKSYISEEKAKVLSEINNKLMKVGAFMHVGVSITTINFLEEIEQMASSYEKRVESIKNLNNFSIPCSVIIKPLLPVLTLEELKRIIDDTSDYCDNFVYGPLYLNTKIKKYLENKGILVVCKRHKASWMKEKPEREIFDLKQMADIVCFLKNYCSEVGKTAFESNDDAVEDIRRKIMENDVLELKNLINNCYGDLKIRSSAMLIDDLGKRYYGVAIGIKIKKLGMTCISNVICNAVTEGARKFERLLVYIESTDIEKKNELLDEETLRLLKEFKIMKYKLIFSDGKISDEYLE